MLVHGSITRVGLCVLATAACGGGGGAETTSPGPGPTPAISRIDVVVTPASSLVADPSNATATVTGPTGAPVDVPVEWSIAPDGFLVTGTGPRTARVNSVVVGEGMVQASAGGVQGFATVTSLHRIPAGVRVVVSAFGVAVGDEVTLHAIPLLDPDHDMSVSWTVPFVWEIPASLQRLSENQDSARITLRALAPGMAQVRARTGTVEGIATLDVQ